MPVRTLRSLGLDLSLASTGLAELGYTPSERWVVNSHTVPTVGREGDPEWITVERFDYIASMIAPRAEHADVIAVERPAYGAKGAAVSVLAGLWWTVYRRLLRYEVPVVIIPPTSVKKYATGSGTASKRDVSRSTLRLFPDHETKSGDEDDALIISAMGAHLAGLPLPFEITQYRQQALSALTRPDNLEPLL